MPTALLVSHLPARPSSFRHVAAIALLSAPVSLTRQPLQHVARELAVWVFAGVPQLLLLGTLQLELAKELPEDATGMASTSPLPPLLLWATR